MVIVIGRSLYPDIQFGQFRFLNMLYRVSQTELLQEAVSAHSVGPLAIKRSDKTWLLESSISSLCNGEFYLSPRLLHGFVQKGLWEQKYLLSFKLRDAVTLPRRKISKPPPFQKSVLQSFQITCSKTTGSPGQTGPLMCIFCIFCTFCIICIYCIYCIFFKFRLPWSSPFQKYTTS